METETKILKELLNNREPNTIKHMAKSTGSDYKIVHTAVKRLIKKGLLGEKKLGHSNQITLKQIYSKDILIAEFERREELLKNKNLKVLYETLNNLPFQFIALIFGSYAKAKETRTSDIDLMIITEDSNEQKIKSALALLTLNIHISFFNYKEFLEMKNSKQFNVVNEAIKNNVILINIEDYYRLLNNVG